VSRIPSLLQCTIITFLYIFTKFPVKNNRPDTYYVCFNSAHANTKSIRLPLLSVAHGFPGTLLTCQLGLTAFVNFSCLCITVLLFFSVLFLIINFEFFSPVAQNRTDRLMKSKIRWGHLIKEIGLGGLVL
jgi:hypothetical protein